MNQIVRLFSKVSTPLPRREGLGGGSLLVLLFFLLSSCNDPYSFRIKGEISNIQQADFLIYSLDGGLNEVDTLHVKEGSFDWRTPLTEEATFHIVFPNLSELIVFGHPGKKVKVEGDANELRAMRVSGTDDNEQYTEFRTAHLNVSERELKQAMEAFIKENPESNISTLLQRQLTLQDIGYSRLKRGDKLPKIVLPPDGLTSTTDTLTFKAGQPVLLIFWASWNRESTGNFFDILRLRRQVANLPLERKIRPVSISLDLEPQDYTSTCRYDSVIWESRCYRQSWSTPVVEQLGIRELPYYILTDDKQRVVAQGTDWKNHIQEAAFSIIHP